MSGHESDTREIARFKGVDVGLRGSALVWCGVFEGEGWGQGFGFVIDVDFIRGMLATCHVETVRALEGRVVWVTHCHDRIHKIEPLFAKDGEPFDIEAWSESRK